MREQQDLGAARVYCRRSFCVLGLLCRVPAGSAASIRENIEHTVEHSRLVLERADP